MEDPRAGAASNARMWWDEVRTSAPADLAGLWFGIVELAHPVAGWHMYVAGTQTFDPDDETAEWAVPDYAWRPEHSYLAVPDLGSLPSPEALDRAVEIIRTIEPRRDLPVSGVAAGFDDGDFQMLYGR